MHENVQYNPHIAILGEHNFHSRWLQSKMNMKAVYYKEKNKEPRK